MKQFLIIGLLLITGCSAEAFEERQDLRVLNSIDSATFQDNPEFMLSKCYELSAPVKQACFDEYIKVKQNRGEVILDDVCIRIGCS